MGNLLITVSCNLIKISQGKAYFWHFQCFWHFNSLVLTRSSCHECGRTTPVNQKQPSRANSSDPGSWGRERDNPQM